MQLIDYVFTTIPIGNTVNSVLALVRKKHDAHR